MRLATSLAALAVATACFGCGGSTDDDGGVAIHTGPLTLIPNMDGDPVWPTSIWGRLWRDGASRPVFLDTGSVYYFVAPTSNPPDELPCDKPETFTYGGGAAEYCPVDGILEMIDSEGRHTEISSEEIRYGDAYFTDWSTSPYAILGLSGNRVGKNQGGLKTVTEQLRPEFMSFEWPDGRSNPGNFQFAALDRPAGSGLTLPLVSPTTLGYGYTARFDRVDFIKDNAVHTSVVNRHDAKEASDRGVYLIVEGMDQGKIADDFVSFFDTGTSVPFDWGDGDYSLLGKDVQKGNITPSGSSPLYDSFTVMFTDANGHKVFMQSGPQSDYVSWGYQVNLITKAVLPEGMKLAYAVLGLNFIAMWDFQIDHDEDGWAKTITFYER